MAIAQLPAGVVKYYRESDGHYYIWDGNFANPMYDLNDPALGLGNDLNEIYADTLTAINIELVDDDEFEAFMDFLTAYRAVLVQQIANAVNP